MEKYHFSIILVLSVIGVFLLVLIFNRILIKWFIRKPDFIDSNKIKKTNDPFIVMLNIVCIIFGFGMLGSIFISEIIYGVAVRRSELILFFSGAPVLFVFGFFILRSIFSPATNELEETRVCQCLELKLSAPIYLNRAKRIIEEESEKHPNLIDNRSNLDIRNRVPLVAVRSFNIDDYSFIIQVWAWEQNYSTAFIMKYELYESIKKRLAAEGIEVLMPMEPSILHLATQNIGKSTEKYLSKINKKLTENTNYFEKKNTLLCFLFSIDAIR